MKQKISITVDENILRQIDAVASKLGINRSRYIEKLIRRDFEDIPVLILAGGNKINNKDKSLVEYNNKKLIDHQLLYLKRQDFYKVYVATNSRLVEDYIRRKYKNVKVFYEKESLGTGGALKKWGKELKSMFLLVHGDILFGVNLKQLVTFHKENKSSATLVIKSMKEFNKYGVVALEGSSIIDFKEKPKQSNTYLCYTGIAIFDQKSINLLKNKGLYEHQLNKIPNKFGYVFEGFWKAFETEKDLEL